MKLGNLLKILAVPAAIGLVAWLEKRRPLRKTVEPKIIRTGRNLTIAATASAAMILLEKPAINFFTKFVEKHRVGLLKIFKLSRPLEIALAVILLDYMLYLWHVLTHKVPFLWRFHLVHHVDLDLDGTTAFRFHFGEIVISVAWRSMQILLIGASLEAVKIWQSLLFPAVLFHHSNIKLPAEFEEKLALLFVTPRLHGIHHSAVQNETDSNWSSIFSIWDRVHQTLKTDVPQDAITIGVPAFQNPTDIELTKILELPFQTQKPDWNLSNGADNSR
jgi:sterol desaturase/sphingolipid hydroxylase (fatty acid hydroxylase superfamily)